MLNSNIELAKKEVIKLFKDEETYHRYVLSNFNKNITSAFATNRKNGLYISCEMDLRGFDGEYQDFARFHNSDRFNYSVISTGQDSLYRLEVGAFCCGIKETNESLRLLGYYDMFDDNRSSFINTPEILRVNKEHSNYKYLKEENVSRTRNLPFLMMDENTISAFTYFRMMVFNKTREYMDNGINEEVNKYGYRYGEKYSNNYCAYALAIRDTCKFFETFYSPDKVKFTPTRLPYKGLAVIQTKLNNIKDTFNVPEVGTMRLFDTHASKLPTLRESSHNLTYIMTKYAILKGKFVGSSEFQSVREELQNIIAYPKGIAFDNMGRSIQTDTDTVKEPIKERELDDYSKKNEEYEHILNTTTNMIKNNMTYQDVPEFDKMINQTTPLSDYLNSVKGNLYNNSRYLENLQSQIQPYKTGGARQYPMYFEIKVPNGNNIYISNAGDFIESKNFPIIVENINKILNLVDGIDRTHLSAKSQYKAFSTSVKEVKQCEYDVDNYDKAVRYDPDEYYQYIDVDSGERVVGNDAKYELNNAKKAYIQNYTLLKSNYEKISKDYASLDILLRDTKALMEDSIQNEGLTAENFLGFDHFIQNTLDMQEEQKENNIMK